jgi:hypothetical protein
VYEYPRAVSVVAFTLGCVDMIRGVSHTILSSHAATHVAGLNLSGPAGHDQLVLMTAFGASNFISAAALIYLSIRDRFGALMLLAIIPVAYLAARIGLAVNGAGLDGQGVFLGRYMMAGYLAVCVATVSVAFLRRHRSQMRSHASDATNLSAATSRSEVRAEGQ